MATAKWSSIDGIYVGGEEALEESGQASFGWPEEKFETFKTAERLYSGNNGAEMKHILECAGYEIGKSRRESEHALHWAVRYGHDHIVKWLLDQGANADFVFRGSRNALPTDRGSTPLQQAARYGQSNTARMLLEHEADIRLRNEQQSRVTALHVAVEICYDSIVSLLLDFDADFEATSGLGYLSKLRRDSVGADFQSVRKLTNYVCATPLESCLSVFSNIY